MGVFLSTVRAEAQKQKAEIEKTTNDALNSLVDLAKVQTVLFKTQTKDKSDTTKINVRKFFREDTVIKCSVDDDAKKIANHISKFYKSFANQDVANAIGDVLSAALDALFGSAVANSNEETKYFVTIGSLGYPYRVDMHLYTYSFKSETLTKMTKNVLAVSLMISSVDLTDLTESDLGAIVQACYQESNEETMKKILEKLNKIRKEQIEEKSGGSSSGSGSDKAAFGSDKAAFGSDKAAFWGDKGGLATGKRHLDFGIIDKESHDAWGNAMKEEEAITSYQPPKVSESLRSLLDKLD